MTDQLYQDLISQKSYTILEGVFLSELDDSIFKLIQADYPQAKESDFISYEGLTNYRMTHLKRMIEKANDQNKKIQDTVHASKMQETISAMDMHSQWNEKLTFGQKVADNVARFGGSWTFIISFILILAVWTFVNGIHLFGVGFDPYPFILLNLVLSTVAAIQAPLIMMSQNRASDYDRFQAKNDYDVNLKSEAEVRALNEKLDHLLNQDQADFLEIQKLQSEMLVSISIQLAELQKQHRK
jgi:uncharacterized membrane protein